MNLIDVLTTGDDRAHELGERVWLEEAAKDLIGAIRGYSGWTVLAASPQAERVLGAAMMIDNSIVAVPPTSGGGVIVFDVNIASGTLIASAARRAKRAGAGTVVGVALHALTVAPEAGDCGLEHLMILSALPPVRVA